MREKTAFIDDYDPIKAQLAKIKYSVLGSLRSFNDIVKFRFELSQAQSQEEAKKIVDQIIDDIHDNNNDGKYSTQCIIDTLETISSVHAGVFKDYVREYLDVQKKVAKYEKIQYIKNYVNAVLEFVTSQNVSLPDEFLNETIDYTKAISYLGKLSNINLRNDIFIMAFKKKLRDLFKDVLKVLNSFGSDDDKLKYIEKCSDILHPTVNDLLVPTIQSMSNEYRKTLIEAIKPTIDKDSHDSDIGRFVKSLFKGNDDEIKMGLEILRKTIQTIEIYDNCYFDMLFKSIPRQYDADFLDLLRLNDLNNAYFEITFLANNTKKPLTESNIDQIIDIIEKNNFTKPNIKLGALSEIIPLCNQNQIDKIETIGKGIQYCPNTHWFNEAMKKWKADHPNDQVNFQQIIINSMNQPTNNNLKIG